MTQRQGSEKPIADLYSQPVTLCDRDAPFITTNLCPVCDNSQVEPLYNLTQYDKKIVRCEACGCGRLSPPPTLAEIASFYPDEYYGTAGKKFRAGFEWIVRLVARRQTRFLAKLCPPGGRVLDVGCGRGTLLSGLADRGLETHGTEFQAQAAMGADPRSQIRIAPDIAAAGFPDDFFDEIVIWHVLEHLPNPRETLLEAHRILKPGGVIVVAVPNFSSWQAICTGRHWFHLDPPRHLFHFPSDALQSLLTRCGFTCRSSHYFSFRQNPFGWIQSLLNMLPGLPRNDLYEFLIRREDTRPSTARQFRALLGYAALLVGFPFAAFVEVLASLAGRGATVHVVATKSNPPSA